MLCVCVHLRHYLRDEWPSNRIVISSLYNGVDLVGVDERCAQCDNIFHRPLHDFQIFRWHNINWAHVPSMPRVGKLKCRGGILCSHIRLRLPQTCSTFIISNVVLCNFAYDKMIYVSNGGTCSEHHLLQSHIKFLLLCVLFHYTFGAPTSAAAGTIDVVSHNIFNL